MSVKVGGINDRRTFLNNDIESDNYLQVNCCGIYEKVAENSITLRPDGRKDYQIIIIENGNAIFKVSNDEILLSDGEMIIIPPSIRNEYRYSNPVDALWIHFSGAEVENILSSYNIKPLRTYNISSAGQFISYAEKIIKELQLKKVGFTNNCNAYLLNILTLAKRRIDDKIKTDSLNDLSFIIDEMQTHFAESADISYYSKMCNLSESRFAHLFKQTFGISPHKFLLKTRLAQAMYLLSETNIKISEISKSVGYDDPYYFGINDKSIPIFGIDDTAFIIVSEEIKDALLKSKISNIELIEHFGCSFEEYEKIKESNFKPQIHIYEDK